MSEYELKDLLSAEEIVSGVSLSNPIDFVTADSRLAKKGTLFFALPGSKVDGLAFVEQALSQGAAGAVIPANAQCSADPAMLVRVKDIRRAFALACAAYNGFPADRMKVVGITGTNGKTTTTYLLENIAKCAGKKSGVIGTVSYRINGESRPSAHTTPPADYLQGLLADMVTAGVSHLFMEVSSHSLDQHRVDGTTFSAVGFSNLTQDHLDYHHDFETYFQAKRRLFTDLSADNPAVINIDDEYGRRLAGELGDRAWKVSSRGAVGADCFCREVSLSIRGIKALLSLRGMEVTINSCLMGQFNLDNIMMASSLAAAIGFTAEEIAEGINSLQLVPGRLEQVKVPGLRHPTVLVDYAHTPDALARALDCVAALNPRRLLCVFGCGGDRDNTKRPLMGAEVAKKAALAVVTSDNPRTEDPQKIIDMIIPGVTGAGMKLSNGKTDGYLVLADRAAAIDFAIRIAHHDDLILIAGKGHEDYQIIGTVKHHFSDQEVARDSIKKYWAGTAIELAEALGALSNVTTAGTLPEAVSGVCTDSRQAGEGRLFVALSGEKFDGHDYVESALKNGFAAAMVNSAAAARFKDLPLIIVPDTLQGLTELASWYRQYYSFKIVGLTGSVGKTTSKEMLAAALGTPYKTQGNLNNHIGVPLSILSLPHGAPLAVIEMGTSGPGEIAHLAAIAKPDVAMITNIRPVHLEGLGSLEGIADEKGAIFASQREDGITLVNLSENFIPEQARRSVAQKVVKYATSDLPEADVALLTALSTNGEEVSGRYRYGHEEITVTLPIPGEHNLGNCCAALAAAYALQIPAAAAVAGLKNMVLPKGRLSVQQLAGFTVIDDTYNANPASVRASASTVKNMAGGAMTALCLGHMGELGTDSRRLHEELGAWIAVNGFGLLVTVGEMAAQIADGAGQGLVKVITCASHADAAAVLKRELPAGSYILVKGSRSAQMEKVIAALKE